MLELSRFRDYKVSTKASAFMDKGEDSQPRYKKKTEDNNIDTNSLTFVGAAITLHYMNY